MRVTILICPTPGCGNYYGSSATTGAQDLSKVMNHRSAMRNSHDEDPSKWGEAIGSRAMCPDCKQRGQEVDRQPVSFEIEVPAAAA